VDVSSIVVVTDAVTAVAVPEPVVSTAIASAVVVPVASALVVVSAPAVVRGGSVVSGDGADPVVVSGAGVFVAVFTTD
jgi:hypothetical protein